MNVRCQIWTSKVNSLLPGKCICSKNCLTEKPNCKVSIPCCYSKFLWREAVEFGEWGRGEWGRGGLSCQWLPKLLRLIVLDHKYFSSDHSSYVLLQHWWVVWQNAPQTNHWSVHQMESHLQVFQHSLPRSGNPHFFAAKNQTTSLLGKIAAQWLSQSLL